MSKKDIDKRLTKLFKANFDKQKTKADNSHQIKQLRSIVDNSLYSDPIPHYHSQITLKEKA